ncbi:AraC family transcriptional regulator [Myxococcaceae bacterium GXIMD 01537]
MGPMVRSPARMRFQKPAIARLELSDTRALYVGSPLGIGFHQGGVACLAVALDGTLRVRSTRPTADIESASTALIEAGLRHRVDANAAHVAFLYLDPADALLSELRAEMQRVHPRLWVEHRRADLLREKLAAGEGLASFGEPPGEPLDPRIDRTLQALREGQLLEASVETVAGTLALSTSRFMHLFRAQVGVPFRRYRLWARLRFAVLSHAAGKNWTSAALDAGFSTPSHLSDAFRAMFGTSPSVLQSVEIVTPRQQRRR